MITDFEPLTCHVGHRKKLPVIAIDNLPSLLPREASEGFSADLTPHLLGLAEEGGPSGPWRAASRAFDEAIGRLEAPAGS